ncbi:MAG: c-type cytochrome [Actinobacteria bacterium]|nr:c-type cytochrome [Actinomycetota bacterium]
MLRRVLVLGPAVAAVALATILPVAHAQAAPPTTAEVTKTWLADCAVCHGRDGRGTFRAPSLEGRGAATVDYELTTGRMPLPATASSTAKVKRHKPAYDAATITALTDYVTTLTGGGPAIPSVDLTHADVAKGGEQFRLQCAACHAWAGDGGALLHREAPALHASTPVQIAEAVRVGPGVMPAFGQAALDDQQLADVVAYVRYLDKPKDRGGNSLWHLGPMPEGAVAWVLGIGFLLLVTAWIGEREPKA